MTQNRPAPAYQEYASYMLANNVFRKISLAARGLLYTLRLEHWNETPLPADARELAQLLRFDHREIEAALAEIQSTLVVSNGHYRIEELDNYREYLNSRKAKQSEGGKKGAGRAKANRRRLNQNGEFEVEGNPRVGLGSTIGSLVQSNTEQLIPEQFNSVSNEVDKEWVQDYDNAKFAGRC